MKKFGVIKSKILSKLTESYTQGNKDDVKNIIKLIKENKDFRELYLLYEDMETKYFSDKETAKFYVNELTNSLKGRFNDVKSICEKIDKMVGEVDVISNNLYDTLDNLLQEDNLLNLETKVKSKIELVDYLTKKKEINETENKQTIQNESLLFAVLANNFNVLYNNTLNEEQKNVLKNILNLSEKELNDKTTELKESIVNDVNVILSESKDNDLINKLNSVKKEVDELKPNKFNYYRLIELKNGLK
jgi:hypothetical protein